MLTDNRAEFFLNSNSNIVQYETIQIHHPNFSQQYWIVRNNTAGLTARLEPDYPGYSTLITFTYYPLRISLNETRDNLDYGLTVEMGDLGEILPLEVENISQADGFATKPTFQYRTFRSDDLEQPLFGPIFLEIENFTFDKLGVTFDVVAPKFNRRGTGLLYRIIDIPMLRGAF